MTGQVKGFRQPKQPNKKQVMGLNESLQRDMHMLRQNMQILLQFTQRNMGEVNQMNRQVTNLESLIGYRSTSDAAQNDDIVVLSCIGYDKETQLPFDGGRLDRAVIRVGSGQLIPEFEKQLVGLSANESVVTIDVKFPDDYGTKELAGQTRTFDLVVLDVLKKSVSTDLFEARAKTLEDAKKAADDAAKAKAEAEAKKEETSNEQKTEESSAGDQANAESPQA